jgi:hypothetical protein
LNGTIGVLERSTTKELGIDFVLVIAMGSVVDVRSMISVAKIWKGKSAKKAKEEG